jgi:hypothetical protein
MKKKSLLIFVLLAALWSCGEEIPPIPDDVLKQQQMTAVLTDVHLAQAAINIKSQTDSTPNNMNDYIAYILKQHGVGKEDFLRSLKFYSNNPDLLEQVYDSVITGLTRMEAEIEK